MGWRPSVDGKGTARLCGKWPGVLASQGGRAICGKSSRGDLLQTDPGLRRRSTILQRKFNACPTIGRGGLRHAGDMDLRSCAQCRKLLKPDARGAFCGQRCIWRAWYERNLVEGSQAQRLPLATLPPDAEEILPATGPERLRVAIQLALLGRAPADARGYRVGIKQGSRQLMRWFPPVRFRTPSMFLLDPFEWPAVPRPGTYAVVYMDGRLVPLGGPRFTIEIDQVDRRILLSDGDRTFKPRPRQ